MADISKEKFLYFFTGKLDNAQVVEMIKNSLEKYFKENGGKRDYRLIVNTVENKEYEKQGYAFGWISDIGLYNVLIGLNEDGTERFEEKIIQEASENFTDLSQDWGTLALETDEKTEKIVLPPLIKLDPYVDEEGIERTVDVFKTIVREKNGFKNELYATNLPKEITLDYLERNFKVFGEDKTIHISKKRENGEKKTKKLQFPLIKITEKNGKRNCTITYSPFDKNMATFVLTIFKKMRYSRDKTKLIFFSQSKNGYR